MLSFISALENDGMQVNNLRCEAVPEGISDSWPKPASIAVGLLKALFVNFSVMFCLAVMNGRT